MQQRDILVRLGKLGLFPGVLIWWDDVDGDGLRVGVARTAALDTARVGGSDVDLFVGRAGARVRVRVDEGADVSQCTARSVRG